VWDIHENVGLYSAKAILSFPYFGNGPILGLYRDNLSVHTLVLFHFMFVIYPYNCHLSLVGILPLENLMVISLLAIYKEAIINPQSKQSFKIHSWASDHFAALFHGQ
jgi:hypothetical protein